MKCNDRLPCPSLCLIIHTHSGEKLKKLKNCFHSYIVSLVNFWIHNVEGNILERITDAKKICSIIPIYGWFHLAAAKKMLALLKIASIFLLRLGGIMQMHLHMPCVWSRPGTCLYNENLLLTETLYKHCIGVCNLLPNLQIC